MHRSQIEAIIQKQNTILGPSKVKKILLGIPEIQVDDQGRLINLARDDEQMLNQVVNVFLDFSHEIVKGLLFEIDSTIHEPKEDAPKPIEVSTEEKKIGVSNVVPQSSKDELVALNPEEPFQHSGSDAIQKALESLGTRTSAEDTQAGPSNNSQDPSQGSVQKLNDIIKQYNS